MLYNNLIPIYLKFGFSDWDNTNQKVIIRGFIINMIFFRSVPKF